MTEKNVPVKKVNFCFRLQKETAFIFLRSAIMKACRGRAAALYHCGDYYAERAFAVDGEMEMKTFKELYLAGEIEFEAIDDYVMEWGNSEDERTLAQYLGLNADEEDAWVSDSEEAMKELLDRQKK